jgi:hypothetical protein
VLFHCQRVCAETKQKNHSGHVFVCRSNPFWWPGPDYVNNRVGIRKVQRYLGLSIAHPSSVSDWSHCYGFNLCPCGENGQLRSSNLPRLPCHLFTLARRCNIASARGQNRSLVFKVKLFLPTERKIGERRELGGGGGGCDNDGSTNEGGTERAWNVRLAQGSSSTSVQC